MKKNVLTVSTSKFSLVAFVICLLAFSPAVHAHDEIFKAELPTDLLSLGSFGRHVIVVSDFTGDQARDVVISDSLATANAKLQAGKIHFYSGATQALLFSFSGGSVDDRYGEHLCNFGDLNSDGSDEFGAYYRRDSGGLDNIGRIEMFRTPGLNLTRTHSGSTEDQLFGFGAIGISDLNSNNTRDYLVSAGQGLEDGAGSVNAYDGSTGALIYSVDGTQESGFFGRRLGALEDIDGDAVADFVVFSPSEEPLNAISGLPDPAFENAGRIRAISGKTGNSIYQISPLIAGGRLGDTYAMVSDLDRDGVTDFVAGCYDCPMPNGAVGYLNVYSGRNGALLKELYSEANDEFFCSSAVNLGDLTGDDRGDFACISGTGQGAVKIIRGGNYRTLDTITPAAGTSFRYVSSGDLNSDQQLDLNISGFNDQLKAVVSILDLDVSAPSDFSVSGRSRRNGVLKLKTNFTHDFELCTISVYGAPRLQAYDRGKATLLYTSTLDSSTELKLRARNLPSLSNDNKNIVFRTTVSCGSSHSVSKDQTITILPARSGEVVGKRRFLNKVKRQITRQ